jgi:hypothetical protein
VYVPKLIFSLKDFENLGQTQAFDILQKTDTWQQVKEFYDEAGNGATLYVMIYNYTKPMSEMLDVANLTTGVKLALDYAEGAIRIMAIGRYVHPTLGYVPVMQNEIDQDCIDALQKAHNLCKEYKNGFKPQVCIVGAERWTGTVAGLKDLKTFTYANVAMLIGSTQQDKKAAAVGLLLGRLAKDPVQRNCGRVLSEALAIPRGYLTSGLPLKSYSDAQIEAIHDKGYITFRRFVNYSGVYFNDDPTCTLATDDFLTIANNRVMNKALTIVYSTYVTQINDEITLVDGKISQVEIAYLRQIISNALQVEMLAKGNISGYSVFIDPLQDVSVTDKIFIEVNILPVGYKKAISVSLGFLNPIKG